MLGSWVSWIITSVLKFCMFRYCANCMYLLFRKFVPIWTWWNQIGMKWALAPKLLLTFIYKGFYGQYSCSPGDIKPRWSLGRNVAFLFTHSGYEKKGTTWGYANFDFDLALSAPSSTWYLHFSKRTKKKKPEFPAQGDNDQGENLECLALKTYVSPSS